jgi:hypothetical protein
MRSKIGLVVGMTAGAAGMAVACSSSSNNGSPGSQADGGTDATTTVIEAGGGESDVAAQEAGLDGASADANDSGATACAAPSVSTNAALCVTITPEAIAFLSNDPAFDGKGLMTLGVYSNAGASDDAGIEAVLLPSQDAGVGDAGFALLNLAALPAPVARFELPVTTAYVRAIFVDDTASLADGGGGLQAGWWLGGYDLSHGIDNAPLMPVELTAGAGTNLAIDLIALRKLTLTVTRDPSVIPAGNGQGPLTAVAVNTPVITSDGGAYLYGVGQLPCADLSGDAAASVPSWVLGNGPYWIAATLDDFGVGGNFPAGALFSLALDGGVATVPSIDELSYEAGAYWVNGSATLTYLNPWDGGADADTVSCP